MIPLMLAMAIGFAAATDPPPCGLRDLVDAVSSREVIFYLALIAAGGLLAHNVLLLARVAQLERDNNRRGEPPPAAARRFTARDGGYSFDTALLGGAIAFTDASVDMSCRWTHYMVSGSLNLSLSRFFVEWLGGLVAAAPADPPPPPPPPPVLPADHEDDPPPPPPPVLPAATTPDSEHLGISEVPAPPADSRGDPTNNSALSEISSAFSNCPDGMNHVEDDATNFADGMNHIEDDAANGAAAVHDPVASFATNAAIITSVALLLFTLFKRAG